MKKIGKILLAIICLFALSTKVKAIYNGQGSVGYPSGSGSSGSCSGNKICQYDNTNHGPIIKAQLYYVNNGQFTPQGDPVYYMGATYKDKNGALHNANQGYLRDYGNQITIMGELNGLYYGDFESASNILRSYFGDDDNSDINQLPNANLVAFFNRAYGTSGNGYQEKMNQETQVANREAAASYGYRLIFEPALTYVNANKLNSSLPKRTILTPIELKQFYDSASSKPGFDMCSAKVAKDKPDCTPKNKNFGDMYQISFLHTEFRDVGIDGASEDKCQNMAWGNFNQFTGCAMNIIDVGKRVSPKQTCYKQEKKGEVLCLKVDEENEGNWEENYTPYECSYKEKQANKNSQYGKYVDHRDNCVLYAWESGHVMLPGGVKDHKAYNLNVNTWFAWPARKEDKGKGLYALMRSSVVYTIAGSCTSENAKDLTEVAKSNIQKAQFTLNLTGGDFRAIDGEKLIPTTPEYKGSTGRDADGNLTITWSKSVYMEINSATNRIYNRTSGKIFDLGNGTGEDRGQGNVSFSYKYVPNKEYKYTLELSNLSFGIEDGGTFTNPKRYVCELKAKRHCECPPDLPLDDSLDDLVANGETCSEAQQEARTTRRCEPSCTDTITKKPIYITDCYKTEIAKGTSPSKAIETCSAQVKECQPIKTCTTEVGVDIPVAQYTACVEDYVKNSKYTRSEAELKCDNKLCGCVVNGATPAKYVDCIEQGNSKKYCTNAFCDTQHVCKQCLYCTTGCQWNINTHVTGSQIAYVKTCDNGNPGEADCGHRIIEKSVLNCIQEQLGVSDILTALKNGLSLTDLDNAIFYCNSDYDNNTTTRDKAIFRIVDLDNPFPGSGVDARDNTVINNKWDDRTNYSAGKSPYSNTQSTSRYPGENYSSAIVVQDVILNGRGVKGDEIYKKSPLYTIVLTPTQMKKIREYNKNHALSDFNLTCAEGTNYCYSKFLHDESYVEIIKDTQKSVCVNIKKAIKVDFENCYEKNN